jgi:hypothetical protein
MKKKTSYLDNIKKELSDRSKASGRASKTNYEARYGVQGVKQPGAQARASQARKNLTKATGQLVGAVLQGRRYEDKTGKQIVAKKTAGANAAMAKKVVSPKPKKAVSGPKGSRTEAVKSVRILGGTASAKEPMSKAMKRTSSMAQSVTPRKKKMK